MQIYLRVFGIIFIFLFNKVNFITMEDSNCTVSRNLDSQCGGYCYKIVKVLLEHASSVYMKEKKYTELEAKLHEQEQVIKHMETQELIMQANLTFHRETIKSKDIQLALQLELINSYKRNNLTDIAEKDLELLKLKALNNDKDLQLNNQNKQLTSKISANEDQPISDRCLGKSTGVYTIKVSEMKTLSVVCDSDLAGAGWIVVLRRINGQVTFNRNWEEYKAGFGNQHGEFFIGLENLHLLTQSQPHDLYIRLTDFKNEARFARYSNFLIGNETESYELKRLGEYSGNAVDAFRYHEHMKFSTPDRDNDLKVGNCAKDHNSGWWFHKFYSCNLNGEYRNDDTGNNGVDWKTWQGRSLKFVQMMIRPTSH
ncbi:fibrinogen-like protein 1 [Drosophila montana]|uniref:fibrinogen-like protein 1 n=1 Tax=Drosophila montana TaxID=40370 RepID=UPI00313B5CFD